MKCSHCGGTGEEPTNGKAVARRKPDLLFEAVALVCGIDWRNDLTPTARGPLVKAVKDLRGVGASPGDVKRRAAVYRGMYRDCTLTPTALAKHWPALGPQAVQHLPGSQGSTYRAVAEMLGQETQ